MTSIWSAQHPNTGQNIQQTRLQRNMFLFCSKGDKVPIKKVVLGGCVDGQVEKLFYELLTGVKNKLSLLTEVAEYVTVI